METPADKASHLASNINDGAPLLKQPTLAVSAKKLHRRSLTGFHTWIRLEVLQIWGGGMWAGWVDWNCMALVATGFFCCVDKLGRPVVKMPWAYLFSKNK